MAKRSLSPGHLPPAKRSHLSTPPSSACIPPARSSYFDNLYDELVLHIFIFLSHTDLCVAQSINHNWARLSLDNQVHSTFISGILSIFLRGRVEQFGMCSCSCGRASTCASLAGSACGVLGASSAVEMGARPRISPVAWPRKRLRTGNECFASAQTGAVVRVVWHH